MEFVTKKIDLVPGIRPHAASSSLATLTMYNEPPVDEMSLDEFETFALDRLQLLRNIENLKIRGFEEREYNDKMSQLENKYMPLRSINEMSLHDGIRKDIVSHFILRLAYCRTQDLRQWLVEQECSLFRHRLEKLADRDRTEFMAKNGLEYDILPSDKKSDLKEKLVGLAGVNEISFVTTAFYRIPFQQAIRLLASRQVYLEGGYAFVPLQRLEAIILMRFRSSLSRALAEAALMFDVVNSDSRIGPLLKNLNKQYVGRDFNKVSSVDKLSPDKVEEAADMHMPLCMKTLHANLKKDHKLKHWGRLQYGLFLKGAGLDMEDALVFFESHFGRAMTHDEFVKNYSYNFRHMYGKEGGRKNYTPYSCLKIILGPAPQPGAVHGCPYRHASDTQLAAMLSSMKIAGNEVKEIVTMAKGGGHYQLACQKHFDVTHPDHTTVLAESRLGDAAANHPNGWFQASIQYHRIKSNPIASSTRLTSAASSYNHSQSQSQAMSSVYSDTSSGKATISSPTTTASAAAYTPVDDDMIAQAEMQLHAEREEKARTLKRHHDDDNSIDEAAMEAMEMMEGH